MPLDHRFQAVFSSSFRDSAIDPNGEARSGLRVRRAIGVCATLILVGRMLSITASAQGPVGGTLADALEMRDAGDFVSAARLLRGRVARDPDDVESARLL